MKATMIELIKFIMQNKKWWLAPILIFLTLLGGLIAYSQGAAIAPFVYTLF